MEIWKDVKGYEGLYQVSDQGRVRSCGRMVHVAPCARYPKGHEKRVPERIMRQWTTRGYMHVTLHKEGDTKQVQVHRIVCEAFHGNPDGKPQVNHIDGDKANNRADNLEWVTERENAVHASAVLGKIRRKLSDEQVVAIRKDARSSRKVAADYDVSHSTVIAIKKGRYLGSVR